MTNVYFVRHAESDSSIRDDVSRPLTEKGMRDRSLVTEYLADKEVTVVASSPYQRAMDTVAEFAESKGLTILPVTDFRERRVGDAWIEDFTAFASQQWDDFNFKLDNGESLHQVQTRNIEALLTLLAAHPDQNIAIGSHGTALSTIVNYFDPTFTYEEFEKIRGLMPWIVHLTFNGSDCVAIESVDLFQQ